MEVLTLVLAYIGALSLCLCILRLAFWLTDLYYDKQIEKEKKKLDELNSNAIWEAIADLEFRIEKLEKESLDEVNKRLMNERFVVLAKEVKELMKKSKV